MVMIYNVEDLGSPHTGERLAVHQNRLNELAIDGWELVAVNGSVVYLRRDSADAGKPPEIEKPAATEGKRESGKREPGGGESGTEHPAESESRHNAAPEGGRRRDEPTPRGGGHRR